MATPEQQLATMLENMPEKTGKSLDQWLAILASKSFSKHGEIVKHLKGVHDVGHGYANLIASKALAADTPADPVAAQYDGAKAALKPIYDEIAAYASSLGKDVEVAPKKASVSFRRKKQFCLVTPATKTRIDLGLALKGDPAEGRLENYNAMCSHRIRLESVADVDDEVRGYIAEAYARAG